MAKGSEANPVCAYGRPSPVDPEWQGEHHCAQCYAAVEAACLAFAEQVRAGKYDSRGYTDADWRAAHRRAGRPLLAMMD